MWSFKNVIEGTIQNINWGLRHAQPLAKTLEGYRIMLNIVPLGKEGVPFSLYCFLFHS